MTRASTGAYTKSVSPASAGPSPRMVTAHASRVRTAVGSAGQKTAGSPPVSDVIWLFVGTGGAVSTGADVGGAPGTVDGAVMITPVTGGDDDATPACLSRASR